MKTKSYSVSALIGSTHLLLFLLFLYLILFSAGHCLAQTKTMKYLGNAFIKIKTSEGKVIYIDPYAVSETDSADIVLITHEHSDHNDLTRIKQKKTCKLIRPADALTNGVYQNFSVGNVKINTVPAYNKYHAKSDGVGYVLEFDGIKVYHAGGSGKIPEMSELTNQKITYALFPLTPGPEEMTEAAAVIQAKHDIPIHSKVSLNRIEDISLLARFTSPHKLVVPVDYTIELVNDNSTSLNKILYVPQYYSTIQSAIDAAQSGDTVLVSEGTYYENINYKGKGIVVASKFYLSKNWSTVQKTVIDGSKCVNKDTASTVLFLSREDSTAVLDGFTITGGTGTKYLFPNGTGNSKFQEGAGIVMHFSSAVIKHNIIINNIMKPQPGTADGGGGGIATMYGNPTIVNNLIVSNVAGYAGGVVLNWSGGKVRNNIIYHNSLSSTTYGNGGIMIWQAPKNSVWVENNTIVGNTSLKNAGGISISLASNDAIPVVRNNIVWANRQTTGKQVLLPQNVYYNNIEDYSDATNISSEPKLIENSFIPSDDSPCIDTGDPSANYNDLPNPAFVGKAFSPSKGNIRNDIGAFGGAFAKVLSSVSITDLYTASSALNPFGSVGKESIVKVDLLNLSSAKLTIDSVSVLNKNIFSVPVSYNGKIMNLFGKDTLAINYRPKFGGTLKDTIKIYFKANFKSGVLKIPLSAYITSVGDDQPLAYEYKLYQNYPNPFNPSTQIRFSVAKRERVLVKMLDILGRYVETLVDEVMDAGEHSTLWIPQKRIASGVYLVHFAAGNYRVTNKLLFLK